MVLNTACPLVPAFGRGLQTGNVECFFAAIPPGFTRPARWLLLPLAEEITKTLTRARHGIRDLQQEAVMVRSRRYQWGWFGPHVAFEVWPFSVGRCLDPPPLAPTQIPPQATSVSVSYNHGRPACQLSVFNNHPQGIPNSVVLNPQPEMIQCLGEIVQTKICYFAWDVCLRCWILPLRRSLAPCCLQQEDRAPGIDPQRSR